MYNYKQLGLFCTITVAFDAAFSEYLNFHEEYQFVTSGRSVVLQTFVCIVSR